jgi:hypothetical protein
MRGFFAALRMTTLNGSDKNSGDKSDSDKNSGDKSDSKCAVSMGGGVMRWWLYHCLRAGLSMTEREWEAL